MNVPELIGYLIKIEEGTQSRLTSDPSPLAVGDAAAWRVRAYKRLLERATDPALDLEPAGPAEGQQAQEDVPPAFLPEIPTQLDIDILEAMDILGRRKDYDWLNSQVRRKYPEHEGQWYELPIEHRDALLKGLKRMVDERAAA